MQKAAKYLEQIQKNKIRIAQLNAQYNEIEERMVWLRGIDYSKDRVQTSVSNVLPAQVAAAIDEQNHLAEQMKQLGAEIYHRIQQIQGMDKPYHADLLFAQYVKGMSLKDLAAEIGLSYGYVRQIKGEALQAFEEKYL